MPDSPPPPRGEPSPGPKGSGESPGPRARSAPPASAPKKRGLTRHSKPVACRVILLDGEVLDTGISKKALGSLLFERVCDHLDLLEKEYFGLTYRDDLDPLGNRYWLDVNKTVSHQKRRGRWEFEFAVKFYPPDPTVLKESLTRYMVCLQIRKDIVTGRLPCTFATQAVLGSFCVQADLGDWEEAEHGNGIEYIRDIPFALPEDQSIQLLEKISELHRDRKGMTPEQAEMQYLEYAKKIAMYGIHMHAAKDSDYVDIKIGIGASGVSVFRENLRINRFVWPKVLKISYRRNKFLLRIRPGEFETFESWIAFKVPTPKLAKRLWKLAIEHHSFLRLREAVDMKRGVFPRFGSKYRYSGRTLYETRVNTEHRSQPYFERTGSKQYLNNNRTRSMDELPQKSRMPPFRDPNLSTTSDDDPFPESPRMRAVENSRMIRQEIKEEDEEPRVIRPSETEPRVIRPSETEPRVIRPSETEPRVIRPSETEPRIIRPSETEPRVIRPSEREPRVIRPSETGPTVVRPTENGPSRDENKRSTSEIKIEHRFVQRQPHDEDDLDSRLPQPPKDNPGTNHHGGVPTIMASVGLPPSVRRYDDSDHSPRGSLDSEDMVERKPAPKQKPPKPPKPEVKKKPVIVREMDL